MSRRWDVKPFHFALPLQLQVRLGRLNVAAIQMKPKTVISFNLIASSAPTYCRSSHAQQVSRENCTVSYFNTEPVERMS